jgi:hypothetical protein
MQQAKAWQFNQRRGSRRGYSSLSKAKKQIVVCETADLKLMTVFIVQLKLAPAEAAAPCM